MLEVNPSGFWECENLKKVSIPDGVKVVGGFYQCSNISQIVLPSTVTEIMRDAFYW
ncbi:MAG: leucine-rich repeat protein [Lachnospirales bacterium]